MRRDRRKLIVVLAAIPALLIVIWTLNKVWTALLPLADRAEHKISISRPPSKPQFRAVEAPTPTVQGKAFGTLKPSDRGKSLESPCTSLAPEIWLEFPSPPSQDQSVRVELPSESKQLLREHWKVLCDYYRLDLKSKKDGEARYNRALSLSYASGMVSHKLSTMEIGAPDGKRKITLGEAKEIKAVLEQFAKGLFSQFNAT